MLRQSVVLVTPVAVTVGDFRPTSKYVKELLILSQTMSVLSKMIYKIFRLVCLMQLLKEMTQLHN